jgi:hypothetical protein
MKLFDIVISGLIIRAPFPPTLIWTLMQPTCEREKGKKSYSPIEMTEVDSSKLSRNKEKEKSSGIPTPPVDNFILAQNKKNAPVEDCRY